MLRASGDDLDRLVAALDDLATRAPDRMLRAMSRAGDDLIREGFDRSRAPSGVAWKPLHAPRSRRRPGRRPLVDTGTLRAWASHAMVVGSRATWDAPGYGAVHQWGTRAGTVPQIPARPFLPPGRLPRVWEIRLAFAAETSLPLR